MHYSVTSPQVPQLMAVARSVLTGVLTGQIELLEDLLTFTRQAVARLAMIRDPQRFVSDRHGEPQLTATHRRRRE